MPEYDPYPLDPIHYARDGGLRKLGRGALILAFLVGSPWWYGAQLATGVHSAREAQAKIEVSSIDPASVTDPVWWW